jgi:hypothetical protein
VRCSIISSTQSFSVRRAMDVPHALPVLPGLDRELEELGHGGVVVEHLGEGPVLGPDDAPLAPPLDRLLLELGEEAPLDRRLRDDLEPLEPEVPFHVPVVLTLGRQTLLVPDRDRLVPVAELHVGEPVRLLPAEDLVEPFPDGHGGPDDIPDRGARQPQPRRVEKSRRLY